MLVAPAQRTAPPKTPKSTVLNALKFNIAASRRSPASRLSVCVQAAGPRLADPEPPARLLQIKPFGIRGVNQLAGALSGKAFVSSSSRLVDFVERSQPPAGQDGNIHQRPEPATSSSALATTRTLPAIAAPAAAVFNAAKPGHLGQAVVDRPAMR